MPRGERIGGKLGVRLWRHKDDLSDLVSAVVFCAKAIAHTADIQNLEFGIDRLVINDIALYGILVLLH